jgi:hypothetical protein
VTAIARALQVAALAATLAGCGGDDEVIVDAAVRLDARAAPIDATRPVDGAGPVDAAAAVPCGPLSCGPGEYCLVTCTCCGIPTDAAPSADYECVPIPASCTPGALCACAEVAAGGACTEATRTIEVPCA